MKNDVYKYGWPWPPKREAELIRLREGGASFKKIAETLGVSRNAVAGKCYRLGLTRHAEPVEQGT